MSVRGVSSLTRSIAVLGAALLLAGWLGACGGGGGSGEVVARVDGTPIDKATLDHWTSVLQGDGALADRSSPGYLTARRRTLSFLISAQWLLGAARELGVNVSDQKAQSQLEQLNYDRLEGIPYEGIPHERDIPAFFSAARKHADRLWVMKLAILTAKFEQRRQEEAERTITPAAISTYYNGHKSQFVLPERRDITWIVVYSGRTLQKAVREVRSGKSLLAVATRVSLDPPTLSGVVLRTAPEKDFARHIFAAKPHVLEGPFRQGVNHYMLEVTKVTPAYQQTLAQSQAAIRRLLAARARATGLRAAFERTWTSKTKCRPGYVVSQCRQDRRLTASRPRSGARGA